MSEIVDKHRAAYQKFFDAINEGGWEKIESSLREIVTPDFIKHIHILGKPKKERTLDEYIESSKLALKELSSQRIAFKDCFSSGNMMASHVIFETTNIHTNEKQQAEAFFVDRFEGDKVAEEWEWVL